MKKHLCFRVLAVLLCCQVSVDAHFEVQFEGELQYHPFPRDAVPVTSMLTAV